MTVKQTLVYLLCGLCFLSQSASVWAGLDRPQTMFKQSLISFQEISEDVYSESISSLSLYDDAYYLELEYTTQTSPVPIGRFYNLIEDDYLFYYLDIFHDPLTYRYGKYYTSLGSGVILYAQKQEEIQRDMNILGQKVSVDMHPISFSILEGKPRGDRNVRNNHLYATELQYDFLSTMTLGATLLTAQKRGASHLNSGSVMLTYRSDPGSLYTEVGVSNNPFSLSEGLARAIYMKADYSFEDIFLFTEYKNYKDFNLMTQDGVLLNSPPIALETYTSALINRNAFVQNANNETGGMIEVFFPVVESFDMSLEYGRNQTLSGEKNFEEMNGILSYDDFDTITASWHANQIEKSNKNYYTLVQSYQWNPIMGRSIKMVIEVQYAKESTFHMNYFSSLSYGVGALGSVSLLYEVTSDTSSTRKNWLAAQVTYDINEHSQLTATAGHRREGVVCIGSICVFKPEFSGVEVQYTTQF